MLPPLDIYGDRGSRLSSHTGLSDADTAGTASDGAALDTANAMKRFGEIGAGDGNRTHDIQLGKLTFYL